jgi:DNA-binding LytR/AlgR family response regulator
MADSNKHSCIIIDDEPIAIKVISNYLSRLDGFEIIGEYTNALDAISVFHKCKVNILFLDIQMPGINGLEFIKSIPNPPTVIFTTAYRNFAVDAFEVNALDYLVKPIPFDRFVKAISKYFDLKGSEVSSGFTETQIDYIILKSDKKNHKVLVNDIIFIESLDDYVKVHTLQGKLVCYTRLTAILELLSNHSNLVRVHRSFIVNTKHIKSFTHYCVDIGDKQIPIGRIYKDDVLSKLKTKFKIAN